MLRLVLALSSLASAQSPESIKAAADLALIQAAVPAPTPVAQPTKGEVNAELFDFLSSFIGKPEIKAQSAPKKGPGSFLRLADVRNNYWNAGQIQLNGSPVRVGFGVSRSQRGYLSIMPEGGASPALIDILALLDNDVDVSLNGRTYTVSLSANPFDKLGSKLSVSGNGESRGFSIRDLIGVSYGKGFAVTVGSREYRVFYMDEIVARGATGRVDSSLQNFAIVSKSGGDFTPILIQSEQVPTDQIGVFSLQGSDRLGLQKQEGGSVLGLYPNP